ncbi:DUF3011 domain-containing protein [Lysobacter sp. A3-1-A15]|uniref:DUF3011 domain-containing protein n=1 Tax=Novilysobacter viscosus TaxID=3098602 RepID=UPI002EDAD82C
MTITRTLHPGLLALALCALPLSAGARTVPARPSLAPVSVPASAPGLLRHAGPMLAGASRGTMQVGLTIVAPPEAEDAGSDLSQDANADAQVRCDSPGLGLRECRLPFRGPVRLSHEVSEVMCVEGGNWGHRNGVVWVDRGCSAVFVSAAASMARATAAL